MRMTVGMDVGAGRTDKTCIAAVETIERWADGPRDRRQQLKVVTFMEAFPPQAPLTAVAGRVRELLGTELGAGLWVYDGTGIGEALNQLFREMRKRGEIPKRPWPMILTGGREPTPGTVPKARIVTSLLAVHSEDRLSFADGLPKALRAEAIRELGAFRPRFNATGGLSFGNDPRLAKHDDWVTTLALAVHYPGRGGSPRYLARDGRVYDNRGLTADPY